VLSVVEYQRHEISSVVYNVDKGGKREIIC